VEAKRVEQERKAKHKVAAEAQKQQMQQMQTAAVPGSLQGGSAAAAAAAMQGQNMQQPNGIPAPAACPTAARPAGKLRTRTTKKLCRFLSKPGGCRAGAQCKFAHHHPASLSNNACEVKGDPAARSPPKAKAKATTMPVKGVGGKRKPGAPVRR
jgi:hypothetical protein